MTGLAIAVLVVLAIAALVSTDERERAERLLYGSVVTRREAKRLHPSNHGRAIVKVRVPDGTQLDTSHLDVPEIASAAIIPLICPLCGETFGHGYINEHDGKAFGWIEKRHHDCPNAGAA